MRSIHHRCPYIAMQWNTIMDSSWKWNNFPKAVWDVSEACAVIDSTVYFSQPLVSHNLLHQKYGHVTKNTYWSSCKHLSPPTDSVTRTWQGLGKDMTANHRKCLKIPGDILSGHIPVEKRSTMNHTGFPDKVLSQMSIEEAHPHSLWSPFTDLWCFLLMCSRWVLVCIRWWDATIACICLQSPCFKGVASIWVL